MKRDNDKKVVLITGGSKGIGLATAKMFAANGYTVYAAARNPFTAEGIISVMLDITDKQSIADAIARVTAEQGRLDILVNNAGMGISGPVEYTPDSEADYIFNVNYFGAFSMIKAALPYLRKSKGAIINISSVASSLSIPFQAFYSSSKAALDAMAFALRGELKPFGIRICNVLPGDTKTEFTDSRIKNFSESDPIYKDRIARSLAVMEKDERNGMPAEKTAKAIYKAAARKNPPPAITVGFKYKVFMLLNKILPRRFVIYIIGKLYG